MFNEALAAHREGRLDDAIEGFGRYLLSAPDHVPALTNRANLLFFTGRFGEAADAYRRLCELTEPSPQVLRNLGMALLALGDPAGWQLLNLRPKPAAVSKFSYPQWRGEPLAGKSIIVWQDQGFGDQIQMVRYVSELQALGARVSWAPPRALARLFSEVPGLTIYPCDPGEPVAIPKHDYWTLPFAIPEHVPRLPTAPYLRVPAAARAVWKGFRGVGFVWHGNPAQPVEKHRGLPSPDLLNPLRSLVDLVDLQEPRGDFAGTAAIVEQLDLVISTDTAMAHLCGALGVKCWVLLPKLGVDWRWGLTDRAPWYPSLRLFRQQVPSDWSRPIAEMRETLARELG